MSGILIHYHAKIWRDVRNIGSWILRYTHRKHCMLQVLLWTLYTLTCLGEYANIKSQQFEEEKSYAIYWTPLNDISEITVQYFVFSLVTLPIKLKCVINSVIFLVAVFHFPARQGGQWGDHKLGASAQVNFSPQFTLNFLGIMFCEKLKDFGNVLGTAISIAKHQIDCPPFGTWIKAKIETLYRSP